MALIKKYKLDVVAVISYSNVVSQLRDRLLEELGDRMEAMVLYGSVAKNRSHEESDIDILIVVQEDDISLYDQISKIRTRVDLKNNTLTALVHVTIEELEQYVKLGSPFIRSVAEEGIILYDKGNFQKLRRSILGES